MPQIGQTISHYRIIEKLGGRGMGVAYKAEDTRPGQHVAYKFLPVVLDHKAVERSKREARSTSAVNHPSVCTMCNADEAKGRTFIPVKLLEGQTIKQRTTRGPLELEELLDTAIRRLCSRIRMYALDNNAKEQRNSRKEGGK